MMDEERTYDIGENAKELGLIALTFRYIIAPLARFTAGIIAILFIFAFIRWFFTYAMSANPLHY